MTQNKPKTMQVRIDQLSVDRDVQRPLDETRARRIAEDFRIDAFGVITVSQRPNGVFHIIDGQHRTAAARMLGMDDLRVTAQVYTGLTASNEAVMFRLRNNSRAIQAIDKFRVRVKEGDLVAVQLNAMLTKNGWRIEASKSPGAFASVTALENVFHGRPIYNEGSHFGACQSVIQIVTAAWGHNANGVRAEIVSGLGAFILRHGSAVDVHKLVSELAQFEGGPLGVVGNARTLRQVSGGQITNAVAEIITNRHNKGRRTNRVPEWRAGGAS